MVTKPTARELYIRELQNDTLQQKAWLEVFENSLKDSLKIELPYSEKGKFYKFKPLIYTYNFELLKGRNFYVQVHTDSITQRVFLDLFRNTCDSVSKYELVDSNELGAKSVMYKVESSGDYKLIVQPEINLESDFSLRVYDRPVYAFPVYGKGNEAIQSFWGAVRDGGKRTHEGLDIFADKGTPVMAVADGRIRFTGNRGLGGKQVWLKTGLFGNSVYYAHLDSVLVKTGQRVQIGETLGLVGNSGNARTTKPHLHFGIYQGYRGAVNPLPFVQRSDLPKDIEEPERISEQIIVASPRANLRIEASVKGQKIGEAQQNDTLLLLGFTENWAHVRSKSGQKGYVHRSLIAIP
ncbi:MAG: M23 family metallopeptidase [Pricia sp.]|nr:M23 family metallopeptidase [Pricia sp.]